MPHAFLRFPFVPGDGGRFFRLRESLSVHALCTVLAHSGRVPARTEMIRAPRRIQESFSAKITLLVASSVILTSVVVGLATMHSTGEFLTDRMKDRFPSTLTTTVTRLRLWHGRQLGELERIGRSATLRADVARAGGESGTARAAAQAQVAYFLRLVKPSYDVYRDLLVLGPNGRLLAATAATPEAASTQAEEAWVEIGERGFEPGASRAIFDGGSVRQWMFVTVGDSTVAPVKRSWLVALVNLQEVSGSLSEVKLGSGGDLYVLDDQGRFVTQPRLSEERRIGDAAMQVPTRQEGPVLVERRSNYAGAPVFHSKVHLDELGWWLVYEEDYNYAMTPVIEAQRRIWVAVLVVGAIAILALSLIHI